MEGYLILQSKCGINSREVKLGKERKLPRCSCKKDDEREEKAGMKNKRSGKSQKRRKKRKLEKQERKN